MRLPCLGGLLVKQMLRHAYDFGMEEYQRIARQTHGIVFLSTPHSGSNIANWMKYLGTVLRASVSVDELEAQHPRLRELNTWFRNHPQTPNLKIHVFCENEPLAGLLVVDQGSADPGIRGVIPVPMDEDHISICKPKDRNAQIYRRVKKVLEGIGKTPPASHINRKADKEFIQIIRDEVKAIIDRRENLTKALYSQAKIPQSPNPTALIDRLCNDFDKAIIDILQPATASCLIQLGANNTERQNTWEDGKLILGWLSLLVVDPDWVAQQEKNDLTSGFSFEIMAKTPSGVEIVSARYRQMPPKLSAKKDQPEVNGEGNIDFPKLENGYSDDNALDRLLLEIWFHVFPESSRDSLDDNDLQDLNETLIYFEETRASHFYVPVHEGTDTPLLQQEFRNRLIEKLPSITLIYLKGSGGLPALTISEFRIRAVIRGFLTMSH